MDLLSAKIDGVDIISDGSIWILYTAKNWRNSKTSRDVSTNNEGTHGRSVSKTLVDKRIVSFEGIIDRMWNDYEEEALAHLFELFRFSSSSETSYTKELSITDEYGNEWLLDVKIKEDIDIKEGTDDMRWSHYAWRVVLESVWGPEYKSATVNTVSGWESQYGWIEFPLSMDFTLDDYINLYSITANGTTHSPLIFQIAVTGTINDYIKIKNISDGTYFKVNTWAVAWDIIIIDSTNYTITKNGVNIKSLRESGSTWQAIRGTKTFTIEDSDGGLLEEDFTATISLRDYILT
jgi:hypothetical protein